MPPPWEVGLRVRPRGRPDHVGSVVRLSPGVDDHATLRPRHGVAWVQMDGRDDVVAVTREDMDNWRVVA